MYCFEICERAQTKAHNFPKSGRLETHAPTNKGAIFNKALLYLWRKRIAAALTSSMTSFLHLTIYPCSALGFTPYNIDRAS
jgi:hypothetical protein